MSFIFPHISIALAFTKSQFLYKATPLAIIAVIATIAIPIGLVKNAIAPPSNVVAIVLVFATVVQIVWAIVHKVNAPLTISIEAPRLPKTIIIVSNTGFPLPINQFIKLLNASKTIPNISANLARTGAIMFTNQLTIGATKLV